MKSSANKKYYRTISFEPELYERLLELQETLEIRSFSEVVARACGDIMAERHLIKAANELQRRFEAAGSRFVMKLEETG